jgi:hypothetical protein
LLAVPCLLCLASTSSADSLESARKFCAVLDASGLLTAKCTISSWAAAVSLQVEANPRQAKEFCRMVAEMAGQNGLEFDLQWTIRVGSPQSGSGPLAVCRFKRPAPTAESFGLRPEISE